MSATIKFSVPDLQITTCTCSTRQHTLSMLSCEVLFFKPSPCALIGLLVNVLVAMVDFFNVAHPIQTKRFNFLHDTQYVD